jgi:hypothetical protein
MRHQAKGMNSLVLIIERDVALTCCGAQKRKELHEM